MSKYYYLIAGLPDIDLEDDKLAFDLSDFRNELDMVLTPGDRKLIDLYFLKYDNKNLAQQIEWPDRDADPRGKITYDEFADLITLVKEEDRLPANSYLPPYFADFIRLYYNTENHVEKEQLNWEDVLAALYYDYGMKSGNRFVADWFELNLNINNILTAITSRKYGLDKSRYIIGNNEVAETLRSSNARDFGLGESLGYLSGLLRIAEETDLQVREKRIDQLKWEWLDENTLFKTFDIESVFAYLIKLEMISRWVKLDKTAGEKTFRKLIGAMKKGSDHTLEEFKRNNKK